MNGDKILNEKSPYLREVWAAGYDKVMEEPITQDLVLIRSSDNYIKRIPMFKLVDKPYKVMRGLMPDGTIHEWLSDGDGSAERFRNLISAEDKV